MTLDEVCERLDFETDPKVLRILVRLEDALLAGDEYEREEAMADWADLGRS